MIDIVMYRVRVGGFNNMIFKNVTNKNRRNNNYNYKTGKKYFLGIILLICLMSGIFAMETMDFNEHEKEIKLNCKKYGSETMDFKEHEKEITLNCKKYGSENYIVSLLHREIKSDRYLLIGPLGLSNNKWWKIWNGNPANLFLHWNGGK